MTTFFVISIIISVIIILAVKNKKNTQLAPTKKPPKGNIGNINDGRHQVFEGDYSPQTIQGAGLQVLETIQIVWTSKAIDTIKVRYDFLLQLVGILQKGKSDSRYLSDIQKSIETYKSMYNDRIPQDNGLALLLKPAEFDLTDFYCKSIFAAFKRTFEENAEEIKLLKREDAKIRRQEKVKEIIKFAKDELNNRCSNALSFTYIMVELEKIESTLHPDINIAAIPLVIDNNSVQGTYDNNSIKPKQLERKENEFVINPGAPFELTLLGADNSLGQQIQKILVDDSSWGDKKKQQIVAVFAEFNLKVKEVEAYKKKYAKVYFDKLEELKNASAEWETAGELDKEDLLEEFRKVAVKGIYEQANCDLVSLFEKEPKDITIDDALIKEYGFENIQAYLRFADNLDKVRIVPNENYNRKRFEKLVELGLSIRGSSIPLEEILSILPLKDLNEIANNPEKQYKRKNQAVEFILAIPNIEEKIGSKIALREFFKLQPLPEKFSGINLQEVSKSLIYTYEVVSLLVDTYVNANYVEQTLKDKKYVKRYEVESFGNEETMCPCAKELIKKKYSKSSPPKIPYHIGCNCSLLQEYNF